jgi:hypothetical protein
MNATPDERYFTNRIRSNVMLAFFLISRIEHFNPSNRI